MIIANPTRVIGDTEHKTKIAGLNSQHKKHTEQLNSQHKKHTEQQKALIKTKKEEITEVKAAEDHLRGVLKVQDDIISFIVAQFEDVPGGIEKHLGDTYKKIDIVRAAYLTTVGVEIDADLQVIAECITAAIKQVAATEREAQQTVPLDQRASPQAPSAAAAMWTGHAPAAAAPAATAPAAAAAAPPAAAAAASAPPAAAAAAPAPAASAAAATAAAAAPLGPGRPKEAADLAAAVAQSIGGPTDAAEATGAEEAEFIEATAAEVAAAAEIDPLTAPQTTQ